MGKNIMNAVPPLIATSCLLIAIFYAPTAFSAEVTGLTRSSAAIGTIVGITGTGLGEADMVLAPGIDGSGTPITVNVGKLGGSTDTLLLFSLFPFQVNGPLTVHFPSGEEVTTPPLRVKTSLDFTRDNRADVLWQDGSGGIGYWNLFNGAPSGGGFIGTIPAGMTLAADADFNGDGRTDLLWRDSSGGYGIWLVNGPAIIAGAPLPSLPPEITFAGVGDLDADGDDDIFLRDSSGGLGAWVMAGTTVVAGGYIGSAPATFTFAGAGDFNRDGKADVLWVDPDGTVGVWILDGFAIVGGANLGSKPTGMNVVAARDFDGDGMCDVYFRPASGSEAVLWRVQPDLTKFVNNFGAGVAASFGDYNGDGGFDRLYFASGNPPMVRWITVFAPAGTAGGDIMLHPQGYTLLR